MALTGVIAIAYVVTFARRRSPWPLGDWLTNYDGGFIRRGLPGELVLLGVRWLHLPLVATAACLEAACVLCMVVCLWPLVGRAFGRGSSFWEKALLLSPATLAFFWLDPGLILRKEIALFALLGLLIYLLHRVPPVPDAWLAGVLALCCPVLLLSHEGLVCYMPYLFAVVALGRRSAGRALKICALPALLSVVAVAAATRHGGDQAMVNQICQSVGGPRSGLCAGPIGYLGLSRGVYEGEVKTLLHDGRMMAVFGVTAMLALLPPIAGMVELWRRPVSRNTRAVLPAAFAASALASIVLFLQAQDWSRWIYIHIMCLLFVLLFAVAERDGQDVRVAPARSPRRLWATVALVLYATTWHLPEWILQGDREYKPFGYGGLVLRLERHLSERKDAART